MIETYKSKGGIGIKKNGKVYVNASKTGLEEGYAFEFGDKDYVIGYTINSAILYEVHPNKLVQISNTYKALDSIPYDGLFLFLNKDNKCGYIDITGTEVIPPIYSHACQFSEGVALVTFAPSNISPLKGDDVIIDTEGNVLYNITRNLHLNRKDVYSSQRFTSDIMALGTSYLLHKDYTNTTFNVIALDKGELDKDNIEIGTFVENVGEISRRISQTDKVYGLICKDGHIILKPTLSSFNIRNFDASDIIPCRIDPNEATLNPIGCLTIDGRVYDARKELKNDNAFVLPITFFQHCIIVTNRNYNQYGMTQIHIIDKDFMLDNFDWKLGQLYLPSSQKTTTIEYDEDFHHYEYISLCFNLGQHKMLCLVNQYWRIVSVCCGDGSTIYNGMDYVSMANQTNKLYVVGKNVYTHSNVSCPINTEGFIQAF